MLRRFVECLASFFYVGSLPWMPGTFGSAVGAVLAWFFTPWLAPILAVLSLAGFAVCAPAQIFFESKDPPQFVLDEVCGVMLGVLWLPADSRLFAAAFLLFRLLDTWKPWPISIIQRRKSPSAIMWDDLAAGAIVNLILQFLTRII